MTANTERERIYRIALLASISCVLQISESMIPHPIPGLRLGLANMLALVALVSMGVRAALEVAFYRTLISSLLMGTFMSPTFILSFSAAMVATATMGLFHRLSAARWRYGFSIIGVSIAGALTHNMVQLFLAYLILVKHTGIFVLFPWLAIGAVGTGWITGLVAGGVCRRLERAEATAPETGVRAGDMGGPEARGYLPGSSPIHRLPAAVKLGALLILSAVVLFVSNRWAFAVLFSLLMAGIATARIPFSAVFCRVRKYAFLVVLAVALPILFNSGVHVAASIGGFHVTAEGLATGLTLGLRILFLIAASALVVMTTSPEETTAGLTRILSPLRCVGVSEDRIAAVFTLAWASFPEIWAAARSAIKSENFRKEAGIRTIIPLISNVIAALYLEATPHGRVWRNAVPRESEAVHGETPASERRSVRG